MAKKLVVVESPTKARTIGRFLGRDFVVDSSYGHIRDLPVSKLGVDIENNFAPQYVIPPKARPVVKKLKTAAEKVDTVILATDEDREGESIAWHLVQALGLESSMSNIESRHSTFDIRHSKVQRIAFHEITERAIKEALNHPREIDAKLVDAQQARRVLDRLVGYKLSPFLWTKIYRGLSAGRVQSVAVRLIVEREREIQNFKPQEYWTISALLRKSQNPKPPSPIKNFEGGQETQNPNEFEATLTKVDGKTLDKFAVKSKEEAHQVVNKVKDGTWRVEQVEKKAVSRNPASPFTTSTLQQEGFRRLGFSAKQTMILAQQLYEGVELGSEGPVGLITYMRTDSLNLSAEALSQAAIFLKTTLGDQYVLPQPRRFTTKTKGAQEAHEAIRPADPRRTPESLQKFLERKQFRLYDLIWRRFIATQMPAAIFDSTTVDIAVTSDGQRPTANYIFRAAGQTLRFNGFLKIYPVQFSELTLPDLQPKEELKLQKLTPHQHFTEPPPRFTEASLVKTLEKYGIGRPSTYAPIISAIQERKYVERHERRTLKPTEIGFLVNDLLVEHFPEVVDVQFTAKMEDELDEIASGKLQWQPVIRDFYAPFAKRLAEKYETVTKQRAAEQTGELCPKCGKPLVVKWSRFGKFVACSGFPECAYKKSLNENKNAASQSLGMPCLKCSEGEIVVRRTRKRGKTFYGCSRYPACDWASWDDPRPGK